ncbi:MAG: hypothetical protein LLG01_11665 [Planctomycetaceae bacterium]|nr:hypothetical protein [Planctomycetaceae bacterium]
MLDESQQLPSSAAKANDATLQRQFLQMQKIEAMGLLVGNVAHDFRNQLSLVSGYGQMLMRRRGRDKEDRRLIEQVLQAADRANDLCQRLLKASRREIAQVALVNVGESLTEMADALDRMLGKYVSLSLRLSPAPAWVKTDPAQLQQAILNLLMNARDAVASSGNVGITVQHVLVDRQEAQRHAPAQPGRFVMLTVKDDGVGMDKQTLGQLFQPFFTTKPPGQGTGLGLTMVCRFVRQSGGFITVESRPGKGCAMSMLLPAIPVRAMHSRAAAVAGSR